MQVEPARLGKVAARDKSCWFSSVAATSHSVPCTRALSARRWLLVVVHETPLALASVWRSILSITSVLIWCEVRELQVVLRQLRALKPSAGCTLFIGIPHSKTRHSFALPTSGVSTQVLYHSIVPSSKFILHCRCVTLFIGLHVNLVVEVKGTVLAYHTSHYKLTISNKLQFSLEVLQDTSILSGLLVCNHVAVATPALLQDLIVFAVGVKPRPAYCITPAIPHRLLPDRLFSRTPPVGD